MPDAPRLHAVTGAFGYSGRAITRRLVAAGVPVRNLTGSPDRADPFGGRVEVAGLDLDDPRALRAALAGVDVLVNTYWVRFPRGRLTHAVAVERSSRLFAAARDAGVRRVVHTSITNPSAMSRLTYFRGKAAVEMALRESGLSYAILRPAVFFGERDVLVNNIAWAVRRLPVFGIPRGDFRVQPIHVDDFARLAVELSASHEDVVLDAVGPEAPAYRDLVTTIARAVGASPRIVALPRAVIHLSAKILDFVTHDVVLTRQEIDGLADGLLASRGPATGSTRLSEWLAASAPTLGIEWASELGRHYR